MKSSSYALLASLLLGLLSLARAAEPQASPVEGRLRQALKEANSQLASAQSELATLQAAQGAEAEETKRLQAENEALRKKLEENRVTAEKLSGDSQKKAAELGKELAKLKAVLDATREEGEKWAREAQALTVKAHELDLDKTALLRKISDREDKNLKLFLLANEILSRYENFGLGKALSAKEPFVGSTRARLELQVQDYQDGIASLRVKH